MDFDDLLRHNGHGRHREHKHFRGYSEESHKNYSSHPSHLYVFGKIMNNKKLAVSLLVCASIALFLAVMAIVALLPFIAKFLGDLQRDGIKGIAQSVVPLLERLWSGTGR